VGDRPRLAVRLQVLVVAIGERPATAWECQAACHSPKREPRPRALGRGLGNPRVRVWGNLLEGSASQTRGRAKGSSLNVRHKQPMGHTFLKMPDHAGLGSWD
jgi:hypothetical protein